MRFAYSTYVGVGGADVDFGQRHYSTRQWFVHPGYSSFYRENVKVSGLRHDIALLQLSSPLVFDNNPTVQPACLPNAHVDISSHKRCYVTGWGQYDPEYRTYATMLNMLTCYVLMSHAIIMIQQ